MLARRSQVPVWQQRAIFWSRGQPAPDQRTGACRHPELAPVAGEHRKTRTQEYVAIAVPANPTLQEFVDSSWLLRTISLVQHHDPYQM